MKKRFPRSGIYAVITEKFCLNGSAVKTLEAVLKAGVAVVQMREKEMDDKALILLGKKYRRLTNRYKTVFIMNDRADIASLVKADGVHLGQDDMAVRQAKEKFPGLIIGCSTHSASEAGAAQKEGADYINIGPVFATKTKNTGKYKPLGVSKLKKIVPFVKTPFSVMGGIKAHNIPQALAAGAPLFAMVTEITMAPDIEKRVKELSKIIRQARRD